jgi:hypothetical protein
MQFRTTPVAFVIADLVIESLVCILHIRPILASGSLPFRCLSVVWFLLHLYLLVAYSVASFSDPGYVDPTWSDSRHPEEDLAFCDKCHMQIPLRAFHCSDCGRCVHAHDHHCVFIDNCVGLRNFRPFLLFCVLFPVHAAVSLTLLFYSMTIPEPGVADVLVLVVAMLFFVMLAIMALTQTIPQIGFALRNSTWLEQETNWGRERLYREANVELVGEFDAGSVVENLRQRIGRKPITWLWPGPNDDQVEFVRNPKFVPIAEVRKRTTAQEKAEGVVTSRTGTV